MMQPLILIIDNIAKQTNASDEIVELVQYVRENRDLLDEATIRVDRIQ